jgi:hypothetical protein
MPPRGGDFSDRSRPGEVDARGGAVLRSFSWILDDSDNPAPCGLPAIKCTLFLVRWIIGDIHGMLRPLATLIAGVKKADAAATFIFVGDYINRGPDAKGVIDYLLRLSDARFCRGNHDDIFDLILNDECFVDKLVPHRDRKAAFKWFMDHGLAETFASYGAQPSDLRKALEHSPAHGLDYLVEMVPRAHRVFMRHLEPVVEQADIFVTHARWDPKTPDEDPSPSTYLEVDQDLRHTVTWGRFTIEEIDAPKTWGRTGYFGHTPVDGYGARGGYEPKTGGHLVPIIGNKLVLLDTAAALSKVGRLTAFCPDTQKFLQADRAGQMVENGK